MSHQSPAKLKWTLQAVPQEGLVGGAAEKKISTCICFEGALLLRPVALKPPPNRYLS
jgi:hypothetical protein